MSVISDRLRELRGSSSQSEMARAVNVKQQNWARWESGVVTPSAEMIATICRVHACSSDWLLGLRDAGSETPKLPAAKATSPSPAAPTAPGSLPQCAKCEHRKLAEKMRKMLGGG